MVLAETVPPFFQRLKPREMNSTHKTTARPWKETLAQLVKNVNS